MPLVARSLLLAPVVLAAACGGSPNAPGDVAAPRAIRTDQPFLLVATPLVCTPAGGPLLGVLMTVVAEGGGWSAAAANGDLIMRFQPAGASFGSTVVSGAIHGSGPDTNPSKAPRTAVLSFQGVGASAEAAMLGTISPTVADTIAGEVTGEITFANIGSPDLHCTRVSFSLRPPAPCELDASLPCR